MYGHTDQEMSVHTDNGDQIMNLSVVRNLLFTPADRPERFEKAVAVGADGAILDLEDGVGLPSKQRARDAALQFFQMPHAAKQGFIWVVRLNHITTEDGLSRPPSLRPTIRPSRRGSRPAASSHAALAPSQSLRNDVRISGSFPAARPRDPHRDGAQD